MKYFKIDNKSYYINMEAIISFITNMTKNERNVSTLITERTPIGESEDENGMMMSDISSKEITESKMTLNETTCNIRYDLVKIFLNGLLSDYFNDDDLYEMTNSQKWCFNTLLKAGIIEEIKM